MQQSKWKSILFTAFLVPCFAFASEKMTPGTYTIDTSHSKVGFEVSHLVISSVEGRFNDFQGGLKLADSFEKSSVDTTIDVNSIDTGNGKRDSHLKGNDFFDATKYPTITFKSKKIEGTPASFKVFGDLTLKGITHPVVLDGKYLGTVTDPSGALKAAFSASTKISRKGFGLTYNKLIEAGPAIGDEVGISLKLQAAKKKDL